MRLLILVMVAVGVHTREIFDTLIWYKIRIESIQFNLNTHSYTYPHTHTHTRTYKTILSAECTQYGHICYNVIITRIRTLYEKLQICFVVVFMREFK